MCHELQCVMTRSCNSQMQTSFKYVIQISRYAIWIPSQHCRDRRNLYCASLLQVLHDNTQQMPIYFVVQLEGNGCTLLDSFMSATCTHHWSAIRQCYKDRPARNKLNSVTCWLEQVVQATCCSNIARKKRYVCSSLSECQPCMESRCRM